MLQRDVGRLQTDLVAADRAVPIESYDWAGRYPAIAKAPASALKVRSVVIDGEAVVCGPDGVSDFD
jgi:hypothetical protein